MACRQTTFGYVPPPGSVTLHLGLFVHRLYPENNGQTVNFLIFLHNQGNFSGLPRKSAAKTRFILTLVRFETTPKLCFFQFYPSDITQNITSAPAISTP
jgi:hypothetical protein